MTLHRKSLTPTLHGVNAHFIHHPSKSRIIQSETIQPKKKMLCPVAHFYTFVQIFGSKFKIMSTAEIQHFLKSGKLTLNTLANSPVVTYSKIQNKFGRAR